MEEDNQLFTILQVSEKLEIPKHTLHFWKKELNGLVVPFFTAISFSRAIDYKIRRWLAFHSLHVFSCGYADLHQIPDLDKLGDLDLEAVGEGGGLGHFILEAAQAGGSGGHLELHPFGENHVGFRAWP